MSSFVTLTAVRIMTKTKDHVKGRVALHRNYRTTAHRMPVTTAPVYNSDIGMSTRG